jgi:uncharacterized protein (DUF1786 family)
MARYLIQKQQVKQKEKGQSGDTMNKVEIKDLIKKKFSKALATIKANETNIQIAMQQHTDHLQTSEKNAKEGLIAWKKE